jgi:BioD-like phosphotransacetylase family protein
VRQLYLAATGQNRGKTTAALGLLDGFVGEGLHTAFMKPVGQRTVIEDGVPADEDAVLVRDVFGLPEPLIDMSPVHIPRGFTKAYIQGAVVDDLAGRIRDAHATFAGHDILLIEGTGHAGVGAVIGLSNAAVAALLGAPAVIVSEGGVGRPIDEIVLNASLFAAHGVEVAGAIVNKVDLDAQPSLPGILERGLGRHGIPLLGVLPVRPILSNPTLSMVLEGVGGETVHPGPDLARVIDDVAIGAMEPGHMLERIGPGTLVIVPGDREDAILSIATAHLVGPPRGATRADVAALGRPRPGAGEAHRAADRPAVGLILTGGYRPRDAVIDAVRRAGIFCTIVDADTYVVASEVHDLLVKTHPADRDKIALIKRLVAEFLDIDRILAVATAPEEVGQGMKAGR